VTERDALIKAIDKAGGQSELARQLTELVGEPVGQPVVSMWLTRYGGRATPRLCRYIEQITGVPASELRPDHYGDLACGQQ